MDQVVDLIVSLLLAVAASQATPTPTVPPTPLVTQSATVVEERSGKASYYYGSRGFHGTPHVAVQDGRWTGKVQRYVEVSVEGSKFRELPVVDYCDCWRGTKKEKIIDLSSETVELFGLDPTDGVWDVVVREIK